MYAWKSIQLNMIYIDRNNTTAPHELASGFSFANETPANALKKATLKSSFVKETETNSLKELSVNELYQELPQEERPYEKCLAKGPSVLTDAELLAVIIRTGTQGITSVDLAKQILNLSRKDTGLTGICHLSLQELMKLPGIGQVKAIQILCIGELSKRIATTQAKKKIAFHEPETIAQYYMEQLRHEEQECMICMMLDTKNQLIGEKLISKGTVNASLVSPRDLFLLALQYHAVHILLVHNHPSGDPTPSQADVLLTERIKHAGILMDIELLDHIIIGDCKYNSFRELGLLE